MLKNGNVRLKGVRLATLKNPSAVPLKNQEYLAVMKPDRLWTESFLTPHSDFFTRYLNWSQSFHPSDPLKNLL